MASPVQQASMGFGIRVDGRDVGISFPSIPDAEVGADRLFAHGYTKIEIFDRVSGGIVKHVSPSPAAA